MYNFDVNIIVDAIPYLLKGLEITLLVSFAASMLALIIAVIIAFFRQGENFIAKSITTSFVEVTRNTPLLIQLYIWYKGLPNIGLNLDPVLCGILALGIYTSAFISEVLRAGINSIAKEQTEAAKALGLNNFQTFRLIILPQAIKIIIPPLGSQFINLVKNSSLVSFIAVSDVFYVIYKGAVDDFRFFEFFIVGALIYMILTGIIAGFTNFTEYKIKTPGKAVKT